MATSNSVPRPQLESYRPTDRRPIANTFRNWATRSVNWCAVRDVHPNTISCSSILASGAAATCFVLAGTNPWLLIAGIFFSLLRLYLNMLDGMVALQTGKASASGEIANELPDRISDVLIFVGIAHSGLCQVLLGYWGAILSLLVAYVGTLGKAAGAHRDFSGPMSKPWRMVALGLGSTLALLFGTHQAVAGLSIIDWTLLAVISGCVATFLRRTRNVLNALNNDRAESTEYQ